MAVCRMLEAEKLIVQAHEIAEDAKAMFVRANELALEYAKAKRAFDELPKASPVPDEDIPF